MKARHRLDREFSFPAVSPPRADDSGTPGAVMEIARTYARIENAMVVVSDLRRRLSHVVYGSFAQRLGLDASAGADTLPTIWEDNIFRTVHPDDLEMKMVQELLFYHHILSLPPSQRFNKCLVQKLRMLSPKEGYIDVCHRLYYMPDEPGDAVRFAVCVYGAPIFPMAVPSIMVDTLTGHSRILQVADGSRMLTRRELDVLAHIDAGRTSSRIAEEMHISVHTVSRHRQNILAKLRVANTAEACHLARAIGLLA